MNITDKSSLKDWFRRGLKPLQVQFAAWMDSYWHKLEKIPVSAIDGIQDMLDEFTRNITKIIDNAKSIEYAQQDLQNIVLTPFKHHLSVNKIEASLTLDFDTHMGKVGIVTLLIHNISDNEITVSIPEIDGLIVLEDSNIITLSSGAYAHAILTGFGDYQTISYKIKAGKIVPDNTFEADHYSLNYNVSDGLGFDINDTLSISSAVNGSYRDYEIVDKPDWLTLTKVSIAANVSTLNIVVKRNRDNDDPRQGNIILKQYDTDKEITITVFQWGKLHEGVPTEYPYTTTEYIQTVRGNPDNWWGDWLKYREEYPVAQVGEQMWIRKNFFQPAMPNDYYNPIYLTETRKANWIAAYPDRAFDFDVSEFNTFVGSHWGGQWAPRMITAFNDYQRIIWDTWNTSSVPGEGNIDYKDVDTKYIQQVPSFADFYELLGFLVAANWDGVSPLTDNYVMDVCVKKTALKGNMDVSANGYDDVRYTYPQAWSRNVVMTGSDDYALSFFSSGGWAVHTESNDGENMKLLHLSALQLVSDPTNDVNYHNTFVYRVDNKNPEDWNEGVYDDYKDYPYGWARGSRQHSGFVAKPFRSVRYRELGYDVYTNGTSILKINTGEPIPEGYSVVDKGALRGAWFGGYNKGFQRYTFQQVYMIAAYIDNEYIPNHKKLIG